MKRLIALLLFLALSTLSHGQDTAVTGLTAVVPTADDLLYVVDAPGGTPISKKVAMALFAAWMDEFKGTGFNIAAEGAIPNDGVDDSAAVQAAVDKAEVRGGVVIIPSLPAGNTYLINTASVTIQNPGVKIQCEGSHSGAVIATNPLNSVGFVTTTASRRIFTLSDGLEQGGPTFEGCTFAGVGSGDRSGVGIYSVDHNGVRVINNSFLGLAKGIELAGSVDNSNWVLEYNHFRDNIIGYDGGTLANDNMLSKNYIFPVEAGDIGILLGAGSGGVTMLANHIACSITDMAWGIKTSAHHAGIIGNFIESCSPAIEVLGGTGNQGRGTRIIGNSISGISIVDQSITCTRTSGSAILTSCGSTAALFAGFQVKGTGIVTPFEYGTGAPGTVFGPNILTGAVRIVSVDSASQVTLSNNATASGSTALTFCYPTLSWPVTWPNTNGYQVIVTGNAYVTWTCNSNTGWDGG